MQIPLKQFEQYIDETILKRGLQYFKKGLVQEPDEMGNGEFEAIVEGSENYTVNLTIKNDSLTESVCSCPYDAGPFCKHIVATLFHLQQHELKLNEKVKKSPNTSTKDKKKTVAGQVDELLEKMTHQDLKEYIQELCHKDGNFRQLFLAKYARLVMPESKDLYSNQIKAILKTVMGRHGFIEYSSGRIVGSAVGELFENAKKQLESANYRTSFHIASAIVEEMTQALEFADDSNGQIGGFIEPSVEILEIIAGKLTDNSLRLEMFHYCLNSFKKKLFKGWNWHFTMLDIAAQLSQSQEETTQIYLLLDQIKPTNDGWNSDFRNAQHTRLSLINKMEGCAAAQQYMEQNLDNSDFRATIIKTAISKKDFAKAIHLAEEGIKTDEKSKPGLADIWREYLLEAYILQKDTANILKYTRHLFLDANREKKPLFRILKNHVAPENWERYVDQLVKDILGKNRWLNFDAVANIYIWEERWADLFSFVKQHVSLDILDTYDKYLVKGYANEISELYQIAILKYMVNNVSRDHYQEVCRYLRRMIKMGAREKANHVIQTLRTLYPQRRALMDELQKV